MKKIILAAVGAVVILGGGAGGTFAYFKLTHHEGPPKPPPPKPIYFAQLDNLVVTVPVDSTEGANQSYVQFSVQFASTDEKAVETFAALQPIVRAETINLLMTQTAKQLMDPAAHAALAKNCLGIANHVLEKNAEYHEGGPFTAAYITNIVEQD